VNAPASHFLGTGHDLAQWKPQAERALAAGGGVMSFEQLADAVDEGRMFMFGNEDGFAVIEPQTWASGLHLHIIVGGGSQAGLESLENVVRIWGRMIGAKKMTCLCRKGFARRVLKQGWKQPQIYLEKEI
jgi:hypothetical protein